MQELVCSEQCHIVNRLCGEKEKECGKRILCFYYLYVSFMSKVVLML